MFILKNAISPEDSFEIERAVSFLVVNYNNSGHNPKPVILHSLRVAGALMEMGYNTKIIIGAILHDILEDTKIIPEQLKNEFGEEILLLVLSVSYDNSITDPIKLYKDMFDRVLAYGKDAVVLKAVDIAVNSLYINLVPEYNKRRELIKKGTYFLDLTKEFSSESAWILLQVRNQECIKTLL